MDTVNVSQLGIAVLRNMNSEIASKLDGEVILIRCPIQAPLDDQFRIVVEHLKQKTGCKDRLIVVLETNGGHIETVKRLVDVMRRHFSEVYFVIASYAYSAGTVLALSGDKIFMDYYSVVGPIDPQYADDNGGLSCRERATSPSSKSLLTELTGQRLRGLTRTRPSWHIS